MLQYFADTAQTIDKIHEPFLMPRWHNELIEHCVLTDGPQMLAGLEPRSVLRNILRVAPASVFASIRLSMLEGFTIDEATLSAEARFWLDFVRMSLEASSPTHESQISALRRAMERHETQWHQDLIDDCDEYNRPVSVQRSFIFTLIEFERDFLREPLEYEDAPTTFFIMLSELFERQHAGLVPTFLFFVLYVLIFGMHPDDIDKSLFRDAINLNVSSGEAAARKRSLSAHGCAFESQPGELCLDPRRVYRSGSGAAFNAYAFRPCLDIILSFPELAQLAMQQGDSSLRALLTPWFSHLREEPLDEPIEDYAGAANRYLLDEL